jgi:hypothetical protein
MAVYCGAARLSSWSGELEMGVLVLKGTDLKSVPGWANFDAASKESLDNKGSTGF